MLDVFMAGYWIGTVVEFLVFFTVYLLERLYSRKHKAEESEEQPC